MTMRRHAGQPSHWWLNVVAGIGGAGNDVLDGGTGNNTLIQ